MRLYKTTNQSIGIATSAAVVFCMLLVATLANAGHNDSTANGKYSFQIESHSRSLPTHYWSGYTFVGGQQGQQYDIRVFNRSAKRIEAVVTVDGRDAISGKIGNYKKNRRYVIEPYGSVLIQGFRTSGNNVAGFYFTDIEDSYAARMGPGENVGVIGVAVFEEKRRRVRRERPIQIAPKKQSRRGTGYGHSAKSDADANAPLSGERAETTRQRRRAPKQSIGTGYGTREYSPATQTDFRRKSRRPNAPMAIYYDDREGLIYRGVIERPRP